MHTTKKQFQEHLARLDVQYGMDLVVHSRMFAFGKLEGGAQGAYNSLRELVGHNATIMVPSYTFQASVEEPYHLEMPGHNTGALSEYVRQLPNSIRSASPIHNHTAIGPKACLLAQTPRTSSLGPKTDFELLLRENFNLLLLGCPFSLGGTYLHHLEALFEVPYREWIMLERASTSPKGEKEYFQCRYYARKDEEWEEDFDSIIPELQAANAVKEAPTFLGNSHLISIQSLHAVASNLLQKNPYALVKQKMGQTNN